MLNYYGRLSSELYDIDKPIGHSFGDVEYYYSRLKGIKGKILEPGTGTGRILIPLLRKGLHVDGFDLSDEMLDICRINCEKENLKPNIFKAKMEGFKVKEKYEAIIVPTGTFLLLYERDNSIKALKNFYEHLSTNGKLIIDISLQADTKVGDISTRIWEVRDSEIITLENKIIEVDHINQYSISLGRYEKWINGVLEQTELEHFPLRWYGIEEFKLILESIGFKDIVISSNYEFGKYPTNNNDLVTFEATK